MEDRYLFKSKRIDNGEWIIGYLYRLSENHRPFIMLENRYGESYEVDEHTICQCTGLILHGLLKHLMISLNAYYLFVNCLNIRKI